MNTSLSSIVSLPQGQSSTTAQSGSSQTSVRADMDRDTDCEHRGHYRLSHDSNNHFHCYYAVNFSKRFIVFHTPKK